MLNQLLEKLGFSLKEAEVYLALLKHGKMSPAEVARLTKISRPTVYSVSKELVRKGVLQEDLGGTSLLLIAKQPEDFMVVVNREQKRLDERKKLVEQTITELAKVAQSTKYAIPKIVFIGEDEFHDYFFKQTPKWHKSIMERDGCWWGFQDHTFVEEYKDYIDWHWQRATPKGLVLRLLSNQSRVEEEMKQNPYPNRNIRFWEPGDQFTASTWICGDFVIMAVTKTHPHYLIEIHDAMMAQNLRQLFKGIWASIAE